MSPTPDVFISYSSRDRERVLGIAEQLERAGIRLWLDRQRIEGGTNYGVKIVNGIRDCKVLMLMCSNASVRSRNVKQEIQLAWKYERPYLPLLLEETAFPEQIQYWLEGWQWIEVYDLLPERWLPQVQAALRAAGLQQDGGPTDGDSTEARVGASRPAPGLAGLRSVARMTDQIWPLPAERVLREATRSLTRGLGAPQDGVEHGHRLGSRVCLAIEVEQEAHLLLLDEGPEGIIYCLCPSRFAPQTRLAAGRSYLPQEGAHHDSFVVTGRPGREHLLAVLTDEPLGLNWMPSDPAVPARVLEQGDVDTLLEQLRSLEGDRWIALSTYFDVTA